MTVTEPFLFESGCLALDLLNTRPISGGERQERLHGALDLDRWLSEAGLAPVGSIGALSDRLKARVLVDARALRDAIESLVESWREEQAPDPVAIETLNGILATTRWTSTLLTEDGAYSMARVEDPVDASAVLVPVAEAAAELLSEADRTRVRQCDDDDCVLWFVDTTRNGRRRWCSMARCGNRNKAAAHYRRRTGRAEAEMESEREAEASS